MNQQAKWCRPIRNESVPKIIINDTVSFFLNRPIGRYNWHSVGFLGWPLPMLEYKYIFQ